MIVHDHDDWRNDEDEDAWVQDLDDDPTMPCPNCRADLYDDVERCPHCGVYLSREDSGSRKPWWVVAGVAACLGMVTWWILHP